jgi:DNA-binding transcriptional LysR family regulator
METFVTVVKLGSYSRAAKDLGVTPALISKRILDLESALGIKLLNRNTHLLSVTGAGMEYYNGCATVTTQIRQLEEKLSEKQGIARGNLRILCSKTFGERVLADVVSEFSKSHGDIAVSIVLRDMAPRSVDLISEGFDLAVRTRPYAAVTDSSLIVRKIIGLPRILVASPEYLTKFGEPRTPQDLIRFNCLNPNGLAREKWRFSGRGGDTTVQISGAPQANSSVVICASAARGLGIAMLSEYTVHDLLNDGRLLQILKNYRITERALYVFYDRNRYLPARTRLFIDYLAKWMRAKRR